MNGGYREIYRKIKTLLDQSTEVFVYFSKFYSCYPPGDVRQTLELLQTRSNWIIMRDDCCLHAFLHLRNP